MSVSVYPSYRQGCTGVSLYRQQHLLISGGVLPGKGGGCPNTQIVNIDTTTHNTHLVDGIEDGGVEDVVVVEDDVEDGGVQDVVVVDDGGEDDRGCRSDSVLVNTGSAVLMVGGRRLVDR